LTENEAALYYCYRLVEGGLATYKEIDSWQYSIEQLNEMHEMLDLKDKIAAQVAEASRNG
jgi:hypothetical protein